MAEGFGQIVAFTNNNVCGYLCALLCNETARRDSGALPATSAIELPIGDSTGEEVIAAAKFIAIILEKIPNRESASARFLTAVYWEIEAALQRVTQAVWN